MLRGFGHTVLDDADEETAAVEIGSGWVACPNCHICYRESVPPEEMLAGYYETEYRAEDYPTLHDRVVQLSRAERILNYTSVRKIVPTRVLDFGCANGVLLEEARNLWGCKVVGVELNPRDRELAWKRGKVKVYPTLDEVSGTFDLIYCAHVLEHMPDPVGFLVELKRHCVPGGHMVLEMPAPLATGAWAEFHVTVWPADRIHQAFTYSGWEHVNTTATEGLLVYWAAGRKPRDAG